MRFARVLDAPLLVAAVVMGCYVWFTLGMLEARKGDVSLFVVAGGGGVDRANIPPGLTITNSGGYDGLSFYRLALNPFTHRDPEYGVWLDNPAYRQQRIGYSFLAWIVSLGGRPLLVPWALVIVNILTIGLLAFFAAATARSYELSGWWGLVPSLYPGFALSHSRDLCEITAGAFLMGGIWAIATKRYRAAAVLLSCAILARETTLLVPFALGVVWLWNKWRTGFSRSDIDAGRAEAGPTFITWALPAGVFVVWQAILGFIWGVPPVIIGSPGMGTPFAGAIAFLMKALPRRIHQQRVNFAEIMFWFVIVAIIAIVILVKRRHDPQWKIAWIAYLALMSVMPRIWDEDFGFMRIMYELFLAGTAVLYSERVRAVLWPVLIMTASVWWYVAANLIEAG